MELEQIRNIAIGVVVVLAIIFVPQFGEGTSTPCAAADAAAARIYGTPPGSVEAGLREGTRLPPQPMCVIEYYAVLFGLETFHIDGVEYSRTRR